MRFKNFKVDKILIMNQTENFLEDNYPNKFSASEVTLRTLNPYRYVRKALLNLVKVNKVRCYTIEGEKEKKYWWERK